MKLSCCPQGIFVTFALFFLMFIYELYGAMLVFVLFMGFMYFVGRSGKYKIVNDFMDSF